MDGRLASQPPEGALAYLDPAKELRREFFSASANLPCAQWTRQRQRRARILATTRQLFAENGYAGVHLTRLAESCSVAVQTIYNLVGGREKVVSDAVEEYISVLVFLASKIGHLYPNYVLAQGDIFGLAASKYPIFHAQLTQSFLTKSPLYRVVCKKALPNIRGTLSNLQNREVVRDRIDVDRLSNQLGALGAIVVLDWSRNSSQPDAVRRDLMHGWGLMLMGTMNRAGQSQIETWLDEGLEIHERLPI